MNNTQQLSIFHFGAAQVREIERSGEPWFYAKDIAEILGYGDTQAMTRRLDEEDLESCTDKTSGQGRQVSLINEGGLYSAILGSNKPEARAFKRWVTHEVLPSIRKTGMYQLEREVGELKDELIRSLNSTNSITKRALELSDELQKAGHRYRKSHTPVSPAERTEIRLLLGEGRGVGEVAGAVGRSPRTVCRVKQELEVGV